MNCPSVNTCEAIVIGVSAGGLAALSKVIGPLPAGLAAPIIVVQHRARDEHTLLEELLAYRCRLAVRQAGEKEPVLPGNVYLAPPGYHLLVERDRHFSLCVDPPVNYSRPSIDVLFETAAKAYGDRLLAVILTGANHDGAEGIRTVHRYGGITVAQDPRTAEYPAMPEAAIRTQCVLHIGDLEEIARLILQKTKTIAKDDL